MISRPVHGDGQYRQRRPCQSVQVVPVSAGRASQCRPCQSVPTMQAIRPRRFTGFTMRDAPGSGAAGGISSMRACASVNETVR